jgi:hypothetical protein
MSGHGDTGGRAIARAWRRSAWLLGPALGLGCVLVALASCARSDENTTPPGADAQPLPMESNAEADAGDGGVSCDAGDPTCTTELVSCDDVAWCSVETGVGALDILTAVWGSGKNDVWAVGSGGSVLHYDGAAWKRSPTRVISTFFGVWGSGPNDVWAVSDTQVLLHSDGWKDGQATWTSFPTSVPTASTKLTLAIWGFGPEDIRIGAETFRDQSYRPGNTLLKTRGGELAWNPLFERSGTVLGIWGSSPTDVWMVVDNSEAVSHERGQTLHGTARGEDAASGGDPLVWTAVDSQSTVTLRAVWGSSASDVWSVGDFGTIRHLTPADTRWQPIASPTTARLRALWGSGPNDIWVVGDVGTILHWDGSTFEASTAQLPIGTKPDLWGVWGSGPNDVWIVGDGIALHYTGPKSGTRGGQ